MQPPIEIAGKPFEDKPEGFIGGFLVVPLNETPNPAWQNVFERPQERIVFEDKSLRVPLVDEVHGNVGRFMEKLKAAIEEANEVYAQRAEQNEKEIDRFRDQDKRSKAKFATDLDAWWAKASEG